MNRTCRTWMFVVAMVGALVGGACRKRVETSESAPPKPPEKPAGLELPKVGRPCESRFAIAPPEGATCNANIGAGWRLYPQRDVQRQAAPSKRRAVSPEEPRRAAPGSRPFCVYEWSGQDAPKMQDFSRIKATRECAIAAGMADAGAPPEDLSLYGQLFDRQVKALASSVPAKPPAALDKNPPVVAVLDASPWGVTKPDVSGHGYAVSRVIGHLSCVGGANAPDCKDFVHPYVALPLVEGTGGWQPGPNGGFIGYFHDVFDAFKAALADRPTDGHLIINLSLGWDPVTTALNGTEKDQMRTLLELAYCQGVLVIAAAGNGNTTSQAPVLPAALETEGKMPDKQRCQTEFGVAKPKLPASGYAPLIHSVGSVDLYDERLPTVRAWAHPRIAAYGMAVTVPGPNGEYFPPLSGTSMSAAAVSGIAADVWRRNSGLDAAQVMTAVFKGGVELEKKNKASRTESCNDNTAHDRCHGWQAVRATLCGALQKMPGGPAGVTCIDPPHPDRYDPKTRDLFPPLPPPQEGFPKPPVLDGSCGITNCALPLGPNPGQDLAAVGPSGVATCGGCRLFVNGGNGILTGSLDFNNGGPPAPYYTTVVLYDSNWSPHYYQPFQWTNNPAGWFWQGMPSGATQDVIAGEIDWGYYFGGVWWNDGASLQISP